MKKEFNIYYQYALYLEKSNQDENKMSLNQKLETRRAFMAGFGQALIVALSIMLESDDYKFEIIDNINQSVVDFFQAELN